MAERTQSFEYRTEDGVVLRTGDRAYDYYVAKVQQRFAMLVNFIEQIFLAGVIVRGLAGVVGLFGLARGSKKL